MMVCVGIGMVPMRVFVQMDILVSLTRKLTKCKRLVLKTSLSIYL